MAVARGSDLVDPAESLPAQDWAPTVDWWDAELPVFGHLYNMTWLNERGAELAIVSHWRDPAVPADRLLEVGNVCNHYEALAHRGAVVDLYEEAPGVLNIDVLDLTIAPEAAPLEIVTISTLEHVWWDDEPVPGQSLTAMRHLHSLLAPGGRMLVTVPTGHNPPLDEVLAAGETGATRACTLVRDMESWRRTETIEARPYGRTQPWAEALWVGEFEA
jgi:hypothetical protein